MSFIDNPVIAGLGEQLGMGEMFSSMRQNAMMLDKAPKSAPNVPEYKNRPYIPKAESPSAGGVRPGAGGGNPITPGAMDPNTLQSPQVQQLLGTYGVQAPTTPPDPNLFVHNPTAHPVLGGLLEHGLEGLAYAHPGQNFLQSLIGGVQGLQQANAARGAQVNAQLEAPIQSALQVQQLQHGLDEHNTAQSTMDYHRSLILDAQARMKAQQDEATHRILATPPRTNPDGTQDILTMQNGVPQWVNDPTHGNSEIAQKNQFFVNRHNALIKQYGSDAAIPPSEFSKSEGDWQKMESLSKGANQVVIQNMRDSTADRNADVRASSKGTAAGSNTPGKLSQVDRARLSDHDKQISMASAELAKARDMSKPQVMADGSTLVGAKARAARIQVLEGLIQQHQAAKAAILGTGPAPAATLPTTFSAGNPFAKK